MRGRLRLKCARQAFTLSTVATRDTEEFRVNDAERAFLESASERGAKCWRNGWPDFLVERDGQKIGIEVKRGSDFISESQSLMFAALETVGLDVFVWNPLYPEELTPWRVYKAQGFNDPKVRRQVARCRASKTLEKLRRGDSTG